MATSRRPKRKQATPMPGVVRKKAIYLRKSRDESHGKEDVLAKHRMQLVELCERNSWEYVIYEEIGSSDSLDSRPKMMQLLADVEDGLYDGVVVMEYERLSRGDQRDAADIVSVFQQEGVQIITPTQTYDLNDETSEALLGVAAIFARMEYRKIKRRLQRGKANGAKQGKWVQGNPPFPYAYDSIEKRVIINEEQRPHYETMLNDALAGKSPGDIAIKMNTLGVKTNRGGTWVAETVQRLLLNPFHMGKVVYGKTKSDAEGNRTALDPDDWIVAEGEHERLKDAEQHARLLTLIDSRRRIANKSKEGKTPLAGLVKCALCGKTHQSTIKYGRYVLFACHRRSPTGEICSNGGARADVVYEAIERAARGELERLLRKVDETDSTNLEPLTLLEAKRSELAEEQAKLSKLLDYALSGKISDELFEEKKAPIDANVRRLKTEIAHLEEATTSGEMPDEERKAKLSTILQGDFWYGDGWTDKERHALLTAIIRRIELRADSRRRKIEVNVIFA